MPELPLLVIAALAAAVAIWGFGRDERVRRRRERRQTLDVQNHVGDPDDYPERRA